MRERLFYDFGLVSTSVFILSVGAQSALAQQEAGHREQQEGPSIATMQSLLVNRHLLLAQLEEQTTNDQGQVNRDQGSIAQSLLRVTSIQVNVTEAGLEVILQTDRGEFIVPAPATVGNALIADIPNAVLALPDGDEFQQFNPVEGIALVTVTNYPENQVRVAITGLSAPPTAEVSAEAQQLIFNLAPDSGTEAPVEEDATTQAETIGEAQDTISIVVTAQKTPEDLQDVPLSVTALTEQEITDADITSLEDVARNTPNFSFFPSGNRFFSVYSIRGFSNASSLVNRDPVDFYVDGVPYGFASFIDLNLPDLERVEVLRGPQSVLYGRNSIAGVVNLITRRPTNEFEFDGVVGYGSFNNLDLRASISGPVVEEQLFFRLSGNYESRNGYVNNVFLDEDVDRRSGGTGRAQLLWTPSEDWEIFLNASFDNYREGAPPYVVFNSPDPFTAEQDFNGFNNLVSDSQSLRITYSNPNFQVNSITSRRFSRTEFEFDADTTIADGINRIQDNATGTIFSQELRFQSPEDTGRFQWLVGGYYESSQLDFTDNGLRFGADGSAFGFPFPADTLNLASVETNNISFAIFGQASYQLTEALALTAGLRYETTNSTLENFERILTIPENPPVTLVSLSNIERDSNALLPRFVAEYRFSPDLLLYGSITSGYRPPGINLTPNNVETATYEAERSLNYEVGLKSSWFNDRLIASLAVFHNSVDGFQVLTFDEQFNTSIENADVNITGAELEIRAALLDGLDLIAGFGYVDAKFVTYPNNPSFNNNRLPYAPDFTYNLAVQYRGSDGIFGRVELLGLGSTFFEPDNVLEQSSYAIVNARLGYERENFGIYLFANNISNAKYVNQAFTLSPSIAPAIYGAPATYGIQFRTRF